jgi:hypothetical protein
VTLAFIHHVGALGVRYELKLPPVCLLVCIVRAGKMHTVYQIPECKEHHIEDELHNKCFRGG